MRTKILFLGLICASLTTNVHAQTDLSTWIGAEVKYDLNKDWSLGLETQTRTDLKQRKLDALFFSPSVSWQPMKYLEAGLSYRLSSVPYSKSSSNREWKSRFTADVNFRNIEKLFLPKKTRLGLSFRLRGTNEPSRMSGPENTLRFKLKFDYNLPKTKIDVFASTELFYRFQRDLIYTYTTVESVNATNKYRIKLGMSRPIGDQQTIKLFGMHQWRYPDGMSEFVLGLSYSYNIPSKK